jgi:hypothetical protein
MLRALLPFTRRAGIRREEHPRCELCGATIGDSHAHVVELAAHTLRCACGACAILFRDPGAGGGRYRTVPRRVVRVIDADQIDWTPLEIPVRLAFVVRRERWVALYPSPAGPVEAELSSRAVDSLTALMPDTQLEAEVEALLLQRSAEGHTRGILVPLDAAYDLIGLVRRHWRGFDGGDTRASIETWISRLEAKGRT